MQSVYHFKSVTEINSDILKAIKLVFKGKAVCITIKEENEEDASDIPQWQKLLGLKEIENIKNDKTELKDWNEVKNEFKFKA